MTRSSPGQIVIADWRGSNRQPDEPNGLRPCVVVENAGLFGGLAYRNVLLVPLSTDLRYSIMSAVVEQINPSDENGASETCWALAHHVTAAGLSRVRVTASRVAPAHLTAIRTKIALAVGLQAARS